MGRTTLQLQSPDEIRRGMKKRRMRKVSNGGYVPGGNQIG